MSKNMRFFWFYNDTGHTTQQDIYNPHIKGSLLEPLENLSREANRNFIVLFIAMKRIQRQIGMDWNGFIPLAIHHLANAQATPRLQGCLLNSN